jgi:hypothetical protein
MGWWGLDRSGSGLGPLEGFCEHGNEPSGYIKCWEILEWLSFCCNPCGGGVEYLYRDPSSRRRRLKGKSQIWDSKMSRVRTDSDPRKTTLARASSTYKRQTGPLVREGAPQKQDRNYQTVINIWSWAPDGARHQDLLTDWPSVVMWLWLWLFEWLHNWQLLKKGSAPRVSEWLTSTRWQ